MLRRSGAVAFGEAPGDARVAAIRVVDDAGERVIDEGPDVDPASLVALDGERIGWQRGGTLREAALR